MMHDSSAEVRSVVIVKEEKTSDHPPEEEANDVSPRFIQQPITSSTRPWYARGGMIINFAGMALNIFVPVHLLTVRFLSHDQQQCCYYAIYLACVLVTKFAGNMETIYCNVVFTKYYCSLGLSFWAFDHPLRLLVASFVIGMVKTGIPMSICLHRYASHQAFSCGPTIKWALLVISGLAHQGGPLWWAANHRAHHKFCDAEGDPHSPQIYGVERAFAFMEQHYNVLEDFVPRHLQANTFMWILDTWIFLVHSLELIIAYAIGGYPLMFVAHTSAWMCQVTTLWFNVINHPNHVVSHDTLEEEPSKPSQSCAASDYKSNGLLSLPPGSPMAQRYPPFHVLNFTNFFFAQLSAEDQHKHHHAHARLAQRAPGDLFYWTFVYPMESCGLVWNVIHSDFDKKS